MSKIKLFILDFDGTALGGYEPYDRFPDNLSAFLDELSKEGILWATCTTWHPYIQEEVFRKSRLKSRPVRAIGRTSLNCGLYINGKVYLNAGWDHEMLSKKAEFDKNHAQVIRDFLKNCPEVTTFVEYFDYIFCAECKAGRKEITEIFNSCMTIKEKTYFLFLPDGKTCQIFPYYMSKGPAVRRIQAELDIPPEQTMIAGDGINDLPMFEKQVAMYQVCPVNAAPEVKETVKKNDGLVSTLPYSDGVVDAAKQLLSGLL